MKITVIILIVAVGIVSWIIFGKKGNSSTTTKNEVPVAQPAPKTPVENDQNSLVVPTPVVLPPAPTPKINPAPNPTLTPTPTPATSQTKAVFVIEADDFAFNPSNIDVKNGQEVEITFKVSAAQTYYGGLDIRSNVFNTGRVGPGESKTVSFKAEKNFTFTSYWPSSGVLKAAGTVTVK